MPAGPMCAAGMGLCSQLSEHPAIAADSNHLAGLMLMAEHAADEDAVLSASRSLIAGPLALSECPGGMLAARAGVSLPTSTAPPLAEPGIHVPVEWLFQDRPRR